tara:strand:+ start:79 stop:642 length:564 start_codon:yes stop_codon:yes gene_type:complete
MKRFVAMATFMALTVLFAQEGKVPNVRLKMLDGKYAKLYDFLSDGPMIIDFWATWCEPCKKQMKHLNNFHNHFSDTGFKVLTINTDTPKSTSKVKSYVRSKKFDFFVAVDPNNQVMKKMRVKLMPTTILVGKDASIIYRHQGYLPGDESDILKHITDHFDSQGIKYSSYNLDKSKDVQKKDDVEIDL